MECMLHNRNRAYDIYRRNFSEASAVGFLSAILFTVFSNSVQNCVDFGRKWMELTGMPYQMNIALLGFVVGYGTTKMYHLLRMQMFKMLLAYQGWMFNPTSTVTKMWSLMLSLLRGTGKYSTFYFEPLLPRLVIPDLNTTMDRFLASMKHIIPTDEEYVDLLTAAETFRVKEGPQLQLYLRQRSVNKRNWLSEFWLNMVYLCWREPTAVNVNCYAVDRRNPPSTNQLARAACLIYNVVRFYVDVCNETLVPQYMQDLIPITMDGYQRTQCTSRIPRLGMDEIVTYKNQTHIVVYRKGVYYKLEVFRKDIDGKQVQVSIPELYAQLHQVTELAEDSKDFCPIGVFTSQNRDYWAKTQDEEATLLMTGHGPNRYFDKCLQYIIYANGRMGVNAEHAHIDATLPGRIWEYALSMEMNMYDADGGLSKITEQELAQLSNSQKLEWDLSNFEQELAESQEHFHKLANTFFLRIVVPDYGKGFIKAKRFSPDGYLQMAIQLAYFKLTGKCVKTYESASTRMFAEGRTETIRPVTEASVTWCKAMSHMKGTTREQKIMLLKQAVNAQTKLKNEAVVGQGWDRHLFGLYACCKELGMEPPALFLNKYTFMPDVLSTSQTPTKYTDLWKEESSCVGGGFAAVNPNGYGISYILVDEEMICFHVTSNRSSTETSAHKMADAIIDAMNEMKALLL